MGFRTIVIRSACKLSYRDGLMIIRGNDANAVYISEIHTLVVDTTMATITAYLLCELIKAKVNVIFCDEKRNPISELMPLYGSHDTSRRVEEQAEWTSEKKGVLWQCVIRQKIRNQAELLYAVDAEAAHHLYSLSEETTVGDETNREGHAAKMYFNRIFGDGFVRGEKSDRNSALDYGYALLLSTFNKEITARGYITQIGIHHHNPFNDFNLASDLMEPFRYLIDRIVLETGEIPFDKEYKYRLLRVLDLPVVYEGQHMLLPTAISRYVRNATEYLSGRIDLYESMVECIEDKTDENHSDV